MRKFAISVFLLSLSGLAGISASAKAQSEPGPVPMKEWTFLVFLNGKNNLDRFGTQDMNEMERVGSTDSINVVVQWGSLANRSTRRVFVVKDEDSVNVTSPVLEDMGRVDMGDWRSLVEFVRWGVEHFPAKRYFIDVWDHGSGWHKMALGMSPKDISWDDETRNFMTTVELGQALKEASEIIGHKVDIYGSDACLMGMAEVATEMADSVSVFVGSEEVEPAEGWPYDMLLERWMSAGGSIEASEVAKILTEVFVKSYQQGSQGNREVTFSAFDMDKLTALNEAIRGFGQKLGLLGGEDLKKISDAIRRTQFFTYTDYGDLVDFIQLVRSSNIESLKNEDYAPLEEAIRSFILINMGTPRYARAHGVAIWLPKSASRYDSYIHRYRNLKFQTGTSWGDALGHLYQRSAQ